MRQIWNVGTNNYVADYIYDHNGIPMAFALSTNGGAYTYYFYDTNLHGDITAVYDSLGNLKVRFDYDAWGNFQQTGNISEALSKAILFRYRSYIYDSEIGLYYLQSRYYDPQTGRFLNVDGALYHHMLGYNLYAYCYNNPANYVDYTGENAQAAKTIWELILGAFTVSLAEPTPFGEIAVGGLAVVGLIATAAILLTSDSDETSVDTGEQTDENGNPIVVPGQLPTKEDGYIAPKTGPAKGKSKDGNIGWKDKNGNIWVPVPTGSNKAHGGGHWDVQSPKGGYTNVYPGRVIRGGKAPFPIF